MPPLMQTFHKLLGTSLEPHHLKWKLWVQDLLLQSGSPGEGLAEGEIRDILKQVSQWPNLHRQTDVLAYLGNCTLDPGEVEASHANEIAKYLLEAGVHISRESKDAAGLRPLVESIVGRAVNDTRQAQEGSVDTPYLVALAGRQGIFSSDALGLNAFRFDDPFMFSLPLGRRSELLWGLSSCGGESRSLPRLVTESDLDLLDQVRNTDPRSIKHLVQIHDGLRVGTDDGPFISYNANLVQKAREILANVSSGSTAANAIWWRAVAGNRLIDDLLVKWTRLCVNKADTLSETERWKADHGLRHLMGRKKIFCANTVSSMDQMQMERILKMALIGRAKRTDVKWRSGGAVLR